MQVLPGIWRKWAVNWVSLVVLGVVLNNLRFQLVIEESAARVRLEKASLTGIDGGNPMPWLKWRHPLIPGALQCLNGIT